MHRQEYCGRITESYIGKELTIAGWVETKRDMGGIIFLDIKDREGTLQVVFDACNLTSEEFNIAETARNQSVVRVSGLIRLRDEETINERIPTGRVELMARSITMLSQAETLPFTLDEDVNVREDLRLKYRFLDLRRKKMVDNLKLRHKVQKLTQDYLDGEEFICVETPMMTKSTPEGARDYLVPSRVHPGTFYALPQSPQIFKQLLMVGGIDKYYQVARCFRDEDLRADRQPEFTQVDMEMSFVDQEDVLVHLEKLFRHVLKGAKGIEFPEPFKRLTWHEAMDVYGSDKPDLRFDLPIVDITDIARTCSFSVFRSVVDGGGIVRAICVKGGAEFTRSTIEDLTKKAISYGAKGMAWIAVREDGEVYSILKKYFSDSDIESILKATGAGNGDFILFCADKLATVRRTLGALRLDVADILGLKDKDDYSILFVTDFPQFEYSEEEDRFIATHHPFTMPYEEDVCKLLTDKANVRAQAYDVVLNGVELGSGSVRIHSKDVQNIMFEALGFSPEETEERFGFMVNAFKYGTPPHAGFAYGLDRLVMLLCGADSLRDVIAFPKVKDASCPMTDAPSFVDPEQLEVLNLGLASERASGTGAMKKVKSADIDIDNVASLARLELSKKEKKEIGGQLVEIINFANRLAEVDTTGVEITAHVVPISNVFREDSVKNGENREELLQNAPTKSEGYITVPKVFE